MERLALDKLDTTDTLRQHNIRLRSALVKLGEQTGITQLTHHRELGTVHSEAATAATAAQQSCQLQKQIDDLKAMVLEQGVAEQGVAFERMVVLADDNTQLRAVIRELEDAAELTAEMEEVAWENCAPSIWKCEDRIV